MEENDIFKEFHKKLEEAQLEQNNSVTVCMKNDNFDVYNSVRPDELTISENCMSIESDHLEANFLFNENFHIRKEDVGFDTEYIIDYNTVQVYINLYV